MTTPPPEVRDETLTTSGTTSGEEELKARLKRRMALTAVVVAGLLSSLVILDMPRLRGSDVPAVVNPPADPPAQPIATGAPAPAEPVAAETVESVPESSDAPQSEPLMPSPAEPSGKPLTKPATGRLASLHPSAQADIPAPPAARKDPAHVLQPSPSSAPAHAQQPSRPLARAIAASGRQFGLQLGVFSNLANAEELRSKLEQNGIPAMIEARVQAGPFASRAEADAARAKLKELGLADSILVTMRGKAAP